MIVVTDLEVWLTTVFFSVISVLKVVLRTFTYKKAPAKLLSRGRRNKDRLWILSSVNECKRYDNQHVTSVEQRQEF